MKRLGAQRRDWGGWAALCVPLIGILPTLSGGVIVTADGPLHVQRITAMTILMQSGNLYPRWVPYFHLGYGYPIFNFYPPGVFWLGGVLGVVGVPAQTAFALLAALAWLLGSVGMYRLARRWLPAWSALLAACAWAYAPSRLFEVWDQGSLPQMMAAALVPFVLTGILDVAAQPSAGRVVWLALALAGLIFSHQPITFITALYALPLGLVAAAYAAYRQRAASAWGWDALRRLGALALGGVLGAGLAAIFLVPLVLELRYVQAAEGAADTLAYLQSNFLSPADLFRQPLPLDSADLRYELPTTFGLVGGLVGALGLAALAVRQRWALFAALLAGLAFTVYMLLDLSLPVWLSLPLFRQLRFPERFLRVGAVVLALAAGAALLLVPMRWRGAAGTAGAVLLVAAVLPLVVGSGRFIEMRNLTATDEIAFEHATATWGTTSYDEFDPIWGAQIPLNDAPEPEAYATDPLRLVVNRIDMARYGDIMQVEQVSTAAVRVRLAEAHTIRFHQYYFPGWMAWVNGQPAPIEPDPQWGLISLALPAGEHVIELRYEGTLAHTLGGALSMVSVLVVGVIGARGLLRRLTDKASGAHAFPDETEALSGARGGSPLPPVAADDAHVSRRAAVGVMVGVGAAAALVWALAQTDSPVRPRSAPDTPAAMTTRVDASFGGLFRLLGYTLDVDTAAAGGVVRVTLFWRAQTAITAAYRPVVQLVNLTGTAAYASSEPFFPGGGHTVGYPLDRFASDPHTLHVFPDAPPYVGRLRVQMRDAATGEALRLDNGADALTLEPLVRIAAGDSARSAGTLAVFDNGLTLACADVVRADDAVQVRLVWRVERTPAQALKLFVHGLDDAEAIRTQADREPLGGDYPPHYWLPGQMLSDVLTLPDDPALTRVALGLYTADDGVRVGVAQNGAPLPDSRLLLSIGTTGCDG